MTPLKNLINSEVLSYCDCSKMIIQNVLWIDYYACLVHYKLSIELLRIAIWDGHLEKFTEYIELILGILFHIIFDLFCTLYSQIGRYLRSQSFLNSNESVRISVVDVLKLTLIEFILGYI